MDINYIIHAHRDPLQVKRLIDKLNGFRVFFYVHIDLKTEISEFEKHFIGFVNVHFLKERINVFWGNVSQVEATIIALKKIVSDNRMGYVVLMSGQDYPIKPNAFIRDYLSKNYGANFIDSKPISEMGPRYEERINKFNYHPNERLREVISLKNIYSASFYTIRNFKNVLKIVLYGKINLIHLRNVFTKRKFPRNLTAHGGSNWFAVPIETVHLILNYLKSNKSYFQYHKYTHCADEIFFHSIVSSLMDSHSIRESVTYVNWSRKNCALPVTFNTKEDLDELVNTYCLFARKFDFNAPILTKIDEQLLSDYLD